MINETIMAMTNTLHRSIDVPGIEPEYPLVVGTPLSYPYIDVKYASWDDFIPQEVYKTYTVLHQLFEEEPLPHNCLSFVETLQEPRVICGNNYPLDLVTGIFFLVNDHPEICANLGLKQFLHTPDGVLNVTSIEEVAEKINFVLENPTLRNILYSCLINQIPDRSLQWVGRDEVVKVYQDLQNLKGLVVDLGCGTGENTLEWTKILGARVTGFDRQYHRGYYRFWHQFDDNNFVRSDIMHGIPLASESVKLALLDSVAPHITIGGLAQILTEAQRILVTGGYLVSAPHQYQEKSGYWRFITKHPNGNLILL